MLRGALLGGQAWLGVLLGPWQNSGHRRQQGSALRQLLGVGSAHGAGEGVGALLGQLGPRPQGVGAPLGSQQGPGSTAHRPGQGQQAPAWPAAGEGRGELRQTAAGSELGSGGHRRPTRRWPRDREEATPSGSAWRPRPPARSPEGPPAAAPPGR